jgi:hypothetical protein
MAFPRGQFRKLALVPYYHAGTYGIFTELSRLPQQRFVMLFSIVGTVPFAKRVELRRAPVHRIDLDAFETR